MSDVISAADYVSTNYTMPSVGSKEMGKDAFYSLLLAEIQNQDPTAPMDNTQMITQLAQFSTLEASNNLNDNMSTYIDIASMSTASSLIGQSVKYLDSESSTYYYGKVSGVTKDSTGYNVVIDSNEVPIGNITEVYNSTSTATTPTT